MHGVDGNDLKNTGREPDLSTTPVERLEADICELAAHIDAAVCRWLLLVAEFDRREGWASWECASCAAWLSWKCGVSLTTAHEHVRVARALVGLPLIREAFGRGEISYSKVRAMTRIAEPALEADLLELARASTGAGLERICRAWRRHGRRGGADEAARAYEHRSLRWWHDDDGTMVFEGRLPVELGELVVAAVERATGDLVTAETASAGSSAEGSSASPPSAAPRESRAAHHADALVAVARTALAHGDGDPGGRRRRRHGRGVPDAEVTVLVDAQLLAGAGDEDRDRDRGDPGTCETGRGHGLAPEAARRLACDHTVRPLVVDPRGNPLHLGRRRRVVTAHLRRALEARDRSCRFPGCDRRGHLDAHHLVHWADGGATDIGNLVLLCGFHHRRVHEGGYRLDRRADGSLTADRHDGRRLDSRPSPTGPVGRLEAWNRRLGLAIDPRTNESLWEGRGPDLSTIVDYFDQLLGADGS